MAITQLDRTTALVVIDLQKGIVTYPVLHPIGEIVQRVRSLAEAFRDRGLPVALVNVDGVAPGRTEQARRSLPREAGWTDLIPELNRQPNDIAVTKRTWGAFASTDLEGRLKSLGATQVVVVGVATATGVESTARQAYELGFNVTLAVDAMTDTRAEAHEYSVTHVFPRLGETGSTQDIIHMLGQGAQS